MSKKDGLKKILYSKIKNFDHFAEEYSNNEIFIAEYDKNSTSYILKSINVASNICEIEVRQGAGKTTVSMPFNSNKVFTILNSDAICFIPIDGKGLLKAHSDFVFFNEQNFCFVEMKLNATSTDERTIEDNRKKAVKQLKNTISYFDTQLSNNYLGLSIEAYIATPDIYPRENTAFQSIKIQFLEDTSIELFERKEKKYTEDVKILAEQLSKLSAKEVKDLTEIIPKII